MSFLSDAFHGNWGNLGTDISHAGSSFADHPMEWAETAGVAALGAAPFVLPELGALGGAAAGGEGLFGGLLGGGEAAVGSTDAFALTASEAVADPIASAIPGLGSTGAGVGQTAAGAVAPGAFDVSAASEGSGIVQGIASNPAYSGAGDSGGFLSTLTSPSKWTLPGVAQAGGVVAAGAGLGMDVMRRNQMDPNQQKLADLAAQLGSSGQVLESYLQTGKLPPALQAQMDQAKAAAKARMIQGYAQRGLPTDPLQNSALAQDLSNLDGEFLAKMAEAQIQMLNTGLKETGMSKELYTMLTELDRKDNDDLMKAIAMMAAALGGGTPAKRA